MKWTILLLLLVGSVVIAMPANPSTPSVETSGNYFLVRVWNPDLFVDLHWKDIDKQRGIGSIIGRPVNSNGTRIQALRFKRSQWTRARVLNWSRSHWRDLRRPLP